MATLQLTLELTLSLCLLLSLCPLSSAQRKDVQVGFDDDGYTFNVYIDGEVWFHSGVLGIRHQGKWWSDEHTDTYSLRVTEGRPTMGSDSIGEYDGVE